MAKAVKEVKGEGSKLDEVMAKLNKSYGVGSVMNLGSKETGEYEVISTGSIGADYVVLGHGGAILGKVIEIRGWEGTGKTTICGNLIANCQKTFYKSKGRKGKVGCVDSEHAVDMNYFKSLGVNPDELIFSQPSFGEEGFNVAKELIETGELDLLIIDSDSGLIPKSVMQGEIGETSKIGKKASLNSTSYPQLKVAANENKCTVVVISQYREKIGQMFGDPKTTQGGHALKFTADIILEMSKTLIKTAEGEVKPGNETKLKAIKNKTFPPFRECKFDILFGEGIDTFKEVVSMAEDLEVVTKSGAWYGYNGTNVAQGFDKLVIFLKDNEEVYKEIAEKVINKLKPVKTEA